MTDFAFNRYNEVLRLYVTLQGVEVESTPDQDATDFTKCLKVVLDKNRDKKVYMLIMQTLIRLHDMCFRGQLLLWGQSIANLFKSHMSCHSVKLLISSHFTSCILDSIFHVFLTTWGGGGGGEGSIMFAKHLLFYFDSFCYFDHMKLNYSLKL